jgi:hypothetical protein
MLTIHFPTAESVELPILETDERATIAGEPLTDGRNSAFKQGDTVAIVLTRKRNPDGKITLCYVDF